MDCRVNDDLERQADNLKEEIDDYELLSSRASASKRAKMEVRKNKIAGLVADVSRTVTEQIAAIKVDNRSKLIKLVEQLVLEVNKMWATTGSAFKRAKENAEDLADDIEDMVD